MLSSGVLDNPEEHISFSGEQLRVLTLVQEGKNVFFTGPAGTGKSLLLKKIIGTLRHRLNAVDGVAVTALTGIAALHIGGITIHSFAGIGHGENDKERLLRDIYQSIKLRKRWETTKTLIIDEISMLDGELFDKLEWIARQIRRKEKPFGGIQLVLSGDFFQLPPVSDKRESDKRQKIDSEMRRFAFQAKTWKECVPDTVFLTQIFRQRDNTFVTILSHIRQGLVTPNDVQQLQALSREVFYPDGIEPTELFPRRSSVDHCNHEKLTALSGDETVYHAMDSAGYYQNGLPVNMEDALKMLGRESIAKEILRLKKGAQVMLIKNVKEGYLVNGSIGKVSAFLTSEEANMDPNIQVIEPSSGRKKSEQVPYSCISNDEMRPLTGHTFSRKGRYPMVTFLDGTKLLCLPMEFNVEGRIGNLEARRVQVPLMLAWAISVHKSQGQTLERVRIDLGGVFEEGQVDTAYVALSRAKTMEGLELHNFKASVVLANETVVEWYKTCGGRVDPELFESEII